MFKKLPNRISFTAGFSIIQVLVAAAMLAGLSLVVIELGKNMGYVSKRGKVVQATGALTSIKQNIERQKSGTWKNRMWNSTGLTQEVSRCFPVAGGVGTCSPITDNNLINRLNTLAGGGAVVQVIEANIVDELGDLLAGGVASTVYFDNNLTRCSPATSPCGTSSGSAMPGYALNGYVLEKAGRDLVFIVDAKRYYPANYKEEHDVVNIAPFVVKMPSLLWQSSGAPVSCGAGNVITSIDFEAQTFSCGAFVPVATGGGGGSGGALACNGTALTYRWNFANQKKCQNKTSKEKNDQCAAACKAQPNDGCTTGYNSGCDEVVGTGLNIDLSCVCS